MNGSLTDDTQLFDNFLNISFVSLLKQQGVEQQTYLPLSLVTYNKSTGTPSNFDLIPWMSDATKQFYFILRTTTVPLNVNGLLYSSDVTTYIRFKLNFCSNISSPNITCLNYSTDQADLAGHGRIFLFI